jgi:hypothetical protein
MTSRFSRAMYIVDRVLIVGSLLFVLLLFCGVVRLIWLEYDSDPFKFGTLLIIFLILCLAAFVETWLAYFLIKHKALKVGYWSAALLKEDLLGFKILTLSSNLLLAVIACAALFHGNAAMATIWFTMCVGLLVSLIWKNVHTIRRKELFAKGGRAKSQKHREKTNKK